MNQHKVTIGLVNPKSPTNVGAVMRAVGCFGADAVFYTGTRFDRAARFQTDTKRVAAHTSLQAVDDLLDVRGEAALVCVELVEGAVPLPDFDHPGSALYVFGPEDGTLAQDLLDCADAVVYIPTVGCLNVAASVNVVLYDRAAKMGSVPDGDAMIRASRDTNNTTKVSVAN